MFFWFVDYLCRLPDDSAASDQQLEAMLLTVIEGFRRKYVGLCEEPLGRVSHVFNVLKIQECPDQEGDQICTALGGD